MSRRTLLRTGAAAGAAGLTAGALGVVATSAITSTGASPATTDGGTGQVVLHVRDSRTGEVEIFTGHSVIRLRDTGITSRISQAIQ
jgi:hypothetical protein